MTDINLQHVFGLKPEAAIRYLEERGKNFVYSWDWHEVMKEKHAQAFTVAKAMKADILQDIHAGIHQAMSDGSTYSKFEDNLKPLLKSKGWWGEIVNKKTGEVAIVGPHRLRTIFDVNVQTGYMVGHYEQNIKNAESRPWWRYVAVMDRRTRPAHQALNGLVFRYNDPCWDNIHPPNGWRCRCHIQTLDDTGLAEREKTGEVARRTTVGDKADSGIIQVEKPLNKQETVMVKSLKSRDLLGNKVSMAPDAGWDYNPGKAALRPFVSSPITSEYKSVGTVSTSPIKDLPAKPLTKELLLPSHQQSGWSENEYVGIFLKEFGAEIGKPVVYKDVVGDALVISEDLFLNRQENKLKVFKSDREVYLKMLADTIKDPVEIWLTPIEKDGKQRLCKRYVGLYRDEKQKVGSFVVFDLVDGEWQGTTAFRPRNLNNLEKQRSGALLYTKK